MGILLIQMLKRPTSIGILVGVGAFVVLALVVMLSALNAEAAGVGPHPTKLSGDGDNSGILLAAKDTPKADASAKDAKGSGGKAAKDTKDAKAKAPAGPPPSKFWIVNTMRANPALVIFLSLAIGYYIGNLKFGNFSLGAVTGTLLVGVLIGQLDITISTQVKSAFFTMFLFAVGYSVGPQFVREVAKDGAPRAVFAVVICALCLTCTYLVAKIAGFDVGYAAGMLAGAQTTSASIGLATDAINNSGIENAKEMLNHIPVAYAICYLWGTIGTGIILSLIGPRLIGADLVEACKQYEAEMSEGRPETGMSSAWHKLEIRAFEIAADSKATGKSVAEVEAIHPETRMFIERIRRDGKIIDFDPGTTLAAGDAVAVSAPTEVLVAFEENNKEIADKELLDIPVESVHPTFGRLPTPTMWFMNSVGLNVFIAIVGISAGPVFIAGLKSAGVGLLIGGVVATSVPMLLAPLIGRFIFKFHPAINLGACGGARTSTASAAMVADAAKSEVPMLGYAVPYAINASLMAMLGMLIVLLY